MDYTNRDKRNGFTEYIINNSTRYVTGYLCDVVVNVDLRKFDIYAFLMLHLASHVIGELIGDHYPSLVIFPK